LSFFDAILLKPNSPYLNQTHWPPNHSSALGVFRHSFNANCKFGLKNGMEFVMNKNPVPFLVNAEEGNDDSLFQKPKDDHTHPDHFLDGHS
jgi:hypothetical protein